MTTPEKRKAWHHCNVCGGRKRHFVLYEENFVWTEEIDGQFSISGSDKYTVFRCCGCDNVSFQHSSQNSESLESEGQPEIITRNYPPLSSRTKPRWLSDLMFVTDFDDSIEDLVREIYIALQNDAPRLAVMGIRALLEKVMTDKVHDQGSFAQNMKAFEEKGYVSAKQREILQQVLEAGHATMHRSYKPRKREVGMLMDIIESVIEATYLNEFRAKGLLDNVPRRRGKRDIESKYEPSVRNP